MTNKITSRKNHALTINRTYNINNPAEAVQMAVLLKNIVVQQKLFVPIRGKNYAVVEGWALAGMLTGIRVEVDEPKNLTDGKTEIKYSCTARLFQNDKQIGAGYALCSSKEALKKGFDEYAIYSMSQTRAIGKAYRNKIGFIMKLAGFQPTPSEEMHKVGEVPPEPRNEPISEAEASQVPKYVCSKCDTPITEQTANFSKQTFGRALCRTCQAEARNKKK